MWLPVSTTAIVPVSVRACCVPGVVPRWEAGDSMRHLCFIFPCPSPLPDGCVATSPFPWGNEEPLRQWPTCCRSLHCRVGPTHCRSSRHRLPASVPHPACSLLVPVVPVLGVVPAVVPAAQKLSLSCLLPQNPPRCLAPSTRCNRRTCPPGMLVVPAFDPASLVPNDDLDLMNWVCTGMLG